MLLQQKCQGHFLRDELAAVHLVTCHLNSHLWPPCTPNNHFQFTSQQTLFGLRLCVPWCCANSRFSHNL